MREFSLSTEEQKILLEWARISLKQYIEKKEVYLGEENKLTENLKAKRGCFVTYRIGEALRGCIGSIYPEKPLYQAVIQQAIESAIHDPRFPRVTKEEINSIHIEISVLSPITPIGSYEEFIPGEHGIILEKQGRRALFLPQVAREEGWSREETLTHLAYKAGLPRLAWQKDCQFKIFTAQVFEETNKGLI